MAKKIRAGLYEYKGHTIERLDKAAEYYPSNDYYLTWRVTGPDTNDGITKNWYVHFDTKQAAINAIDKEVG